MLVFGFVISVSFIVMVPPLGFSNRFKQRKNVDLPEPEGPITATTSPSAIVVEMFLILRVSQMILTAFQP